MRLVPSALGETQPASPRAARTPWLALALWGATVAPGFALLASYATTAGARGATPSRWPADSALPLAADAPTLVLFLHPRCPCSRATLTELEGILAARHGARVEVLAVLAAPAGASRDFVAGEIAERAAAIPGVRVWVDRGEVEARRFGAETSGHAVLFRDRELRFSGGITPTRGHTGPNPGARAIVAALTDPTTLTLPISDLFGCPLDAPRAEAP